MRHKFLQTLINLCGFIIAKAKTNKAKVMLLGGTALIILRMLIPAKKPINLVSISNFLQKLQNGQVTEAVVRPNYIIFRDALKNIGKANHSLMPKQTLYDLLKNANVNFSYSNSTILLQMILFFLSSVIITFAYLYFTRQEDSIKKKPIKQIMFQDIVGMRQPKQALKEVIQYMKNPLKFSNIGARMRKGIILYGPSGTGKTTVAKACAAQAGVQFFACNASEFCQIYIGAGPKKVRQLFRRAKQCAPSIVFIDQIDAIGNRKSKSAYDSGADTQRNSTINQLLSQLDGFGSHDSVLVIAATNKLQLIDKSLLRPGRFDLKIPIALPKLEERRDILYMHLKSKRHNLSQSFVTVLAEKMVGWSGADIQNLANQSVYQALRRGSQIIQQQDARSCMENVAISGRY